MEITLACGNLTEVNDCDYEFLTQFSWFKTGSTKYYATRTGPIYMAHDVVKRMGLIIPIGMEVDHKDRDTFNNQRDNLRVVSRSVNLHNTGLRPDNTSGAKGVHFNKEKNKWVVKIRINGNRIFLGYFDFLEDAIQARLNAEKRYGV